MNSTLIIEPLLPIWALAIMGMVVLPFLVATIWQGRRGGWLRTVVFMVLLGLMVNPKILQERREAENDIVVVAVDKSQSQMIGDRILHSERLADNFMDALAVMPSVDPRLVTIGGDPLDEASYGTQVFESLDEVLADIPVGRLGGVLLITDGQVHDWSENFLSRADAGPLHVFLSGQQNERDRRLVIEQAPSFGIIGQSIEVLYRIDDQLSPKELETPMPVKISIAINGEPYQTILSAINETDTLTIDIDRPGPHLIEMAVEDAPDELSAANNKAAIQVNGVHDRMRVLLISGQPHVGERTWRDLLKSDAAIDLIHFTILRPPEKDDFTPLRELALIMFPVKELFQERLDDFDLVVFDRYLVRDVLPPSYIRNITDYINSGGAMLLAVGPEFSGPRSLFRTPLAEVIPRDPSGRVLEQAFKPRLTDLGRRHPVTAGLATADPLSDAEPSWGRWFRQIDVRQGPGVTLMSGAEDKPLLVLERYGEGRVAQLNSDHVWLWAREFEGGGPHLELMRRLAHWLMKEPELEEESLTADVIDGQLMIERRSLEAVPESVTVEMPDGVIETLDLSTGADGMARASLSINELGVYRVDDGMQRALAVAGALNPVELQDLRTSDEVLMPMVEARGGSMNWLGAEPAPTLRQTQAGRDIAGRGWVGIIENQSYRVTGVDRVSLLPWWLGLMLMLAALGFTWWKEGR